MKTPRPWGAEAKKRYAQRRIAKGKHRALFTKSSVPSYIDEDFDGMGF